MIVDPALIALLNPFREKSGKGALFREKLEN